MTAIDIAACGWPLSRLGEAFHAMAAGSGLPVKSLDATRPPPTSLQHDSTALAQWIDAVAGVMGLEAEHTAIQYSSLERHLIAAAPAVLRIPGQDPPRFLALVEGSKRRLSLFSPDGTATRCAPDRVAAALRRHKETPLVAEVDQLLEEAGVPARRRRRVGAAVVSERLRDERVPDCWLLRLGPGTSVDRQVRQAGLVPRFLTLACAHAVEFVLWILAWWMVGLGALQGRLDRGWLLAWALLLATMVPCRVLATWLQGSLAIRGGALLKQRLLVGALRLDQDEVRREGAGQLLGRVIESQAVESLALGGGLLALVAGIELALASVVLTLGAGGWFQALLLVAWVGVSFWIGWHYLHRTQSWAAARLRMTHDLVERMIGHRTRLTQERPERWHDGEDAELERYHDESRVMDRNGAILTALVPRGWLIVALLGVGPAFVSGGASSAELAVAVGGMLLAFRALKRLSEGLWQLAGAWIAWQQVAPLFHAASRPDMQGVPAFAVPPADGHLDRPLVLEAHDLVFRYRDRAEPVLHGCSLAIARGDRLLLEGPSGCGKSTLAAILTGLRLPESGMILVEGLDRQTLGVDGWRRRIVSAPQFHDNYVLTGTLAFNLLMGRRWPPQPQDLEEMLAVCRELGLEDLLKRMPAGLMQTVGESGWQLSHGERSRLYIARALLQHADLVVLDESFAALDPENLRRALSCVLARARTLLVIAHR